MIKGLDYANDYSAVKYMDTSTALELLVTADGAPFDLSTCQTISVQIANSSGYIMARNIDPTTLDDPLTGRLTLPIDSEIMATLTPDDYQIEVWTMIKPVAVKTTSRTATLSIIDNQLEPHTAIFPSDGVLSFTVKTNLMSEEGQAIAMITLNDFESRFNQLQEDLVNQVANLQGPKGDTGASAYQEAVGQGYAGTLAEWLNSLKGAKGDTGTTGDTGKTGPSAYEIAQTNGFKGTQAEWLTSLVGAKGDTGAGLNVLGSVDDKAKLPASGETGDGYFVGSDLYVWIATNWQDMGNVRGPQGEPGSPGQPGESGKSAFQVAVSDGFTGTESEWLSSLKGEQGIQGVPGVAGKDATEIDTTRLVVDNKDGTIMVNGIKMIPANDAYVVKHNDAGKLQGKLDSDYGTLMVDGAPVMGGTISASQADAETAGKADLASGKLVLRWF